MSSPQLSPPWYTIWNQINSAIGNDPAVTVSQLDTSQSPYLVKITIDGALQAQATASLMKLSYDMGSWGIQVAIYDQNGTPALPVAPQSAEELEGFVKAAFAKNGWYVGVNARAFMPEGPLAVFPIFSKAVIQFPNDDIGDWYFNYNAVAASVFTDVLEGSPGGIVLSCSTNNK